MIALDRLEQIIPSGLALSNKALSVALQQISTNPSIQLKNVADASTAVRTCSDLDLVTDLSAPVPEDVAKFFVDNVAVGSGPNGTFVIIDFFGTLAGVTGLNYIAITNILSEMDTTALQTVYETMRSVVSGQYGTTSVTIPQGLPAAGLYSSRDAAINALIPVAKSSIADVINLYPFQVELLNKKWNEVDDKPAAKECLLQKKAGLDWSDLVPNNDLAMQSWIQNLPNQGLDLQPGGSHWFLQSISNVETLSGQSIIGTLREGVNQYSMSRSGVNSAVQIPVFTGPIITESGETGSGGSAVPNPL